MLSASRDILTLLWPAADLSSRDTRLFVVLNGLEVHLYSRSRTYSRLERLFGLQQLLLGPDADGGHPEQPPDKGGGAECAADPYRCWRDLVPVIKADISTVRSKTYQGNDFCSGVTMRDSNWSELMLEIQFVCMHVPVYLYI